MAWFLHLLEYIFLFQLLYRQVEFNCYMSYLIIYSLLTVSKVVKDISMLPGFTFPGIFDFTSKHM